MMALMGTPCGSFTFGSSIGLFVIGAAKRLLGCAAFSFECGVHWWPRQSRHVSGGGSSWPSHHTVPSGLRATFVKMVSRSIIRIAFGLDFEFVPGTTPK